MDITDIVRSREELHQHAEMLKVSEAKYKNLAEAMPQIVWTASPDGHLTYFNEKMEQYLGINIDEIDEVKFSEFIHPEDLPRVTQAWIKAVEDKSNFDLEYRNLNKKTGEYFWFLTRAVSELGSDGEIL